MVFDASSYHGATEFMLRKSGKLCLLNAQCRAAKFDVFIGWADVSNIVYYVWTHIQSYVCDPLWFLAF